MILNRKRLINVNRFLLDMIPIILGILIALWIENTIDYQRQRKEERLYLIELKNDLETDLIELNSDLKIYENRKENRDFLLSYDYVKNKKPKVAFQCILNMFGETAPLINNVTFLTLQSTGKTAVIKNKKIVRHLISLYADNVSGLLKSTEGFDEFKRTNIRQLIIENIDIKSPDKAKSVRVLLAMPTIRNTLEVLWFDEAMERYRETIKMHQEIIKMINYSIENDF